MRGPLPTLPTPRLVKAVWTFCISQTTLCFFAEVLLPWKRCQLILFLVGIEGLGQFRIHWSDFAEVGWMHEASVGLGSAL